jgi:phosphoglycerate dehydrogenase-like enzyme
MSYTSDSVAAPVTGAPAVVSIAVLDDYQNVAATMADWSGLQSRARIVFFHDHVSDPAALGDRLAEFDAVVLMRERTAFDDALLSRLPRLKLLVTVGMWNAAIDLAAAAARGVLVSGTPGGERTATPTLTWALILAATRNIVTEATSLRAGGWQVGLGADISGKTLGLLGLGNIGQAVARIGQAFGMRTIAWSQNLTAEQAAQHGVAYVEKEALFQQADVLTIHLKLGERTRGLVDGAHLALMKPNAWLVNTSRGPIVSDTALIAALQAGQIAGAALDVFDEEPLPRTHPYRFLQNVLATPHIGYVTENTYHLAFPAIVEALDAWLNGAPIRLLDA